MQALWEANNLPILINFLFESQRPSETAFESLSAPVAIHQVPMITFPGVVKTLLSCQVQSEKEFCLRLANNISYQTQMSVRN